MIRALVAPVEVAVDEMVNVLGPHVAEDWSLPAGSLDWSCWTTAAHVAHDLLAYAGQVAAQPREGYLPYDLTNKPTATPQDLLQVVLASGRLLANAVASASPASRAWHFGPADPAGFEAMGVAETLLHTSDIAQGMDIEWTPPENLCALVLARLFPDTPRADATSALLWATGRGDLPGHRRVTHWVWKAAL